MDSIVTCVLGLVQGLTEFIPVSSSGHLVIAQHFLSGGTDHMMLEYINIGTLVALLIYFRKKIVSIGHEIIVQKKYTLLRNILLTSLPAGVVGYVLSDFITTSKFFGSIYTVLVTLVLVGLAMILLERIPKLSPVDNGESLPWWRALMIGIVQMFALIPGVSRSGSTIIAGRIAGLSNAQAAEYSFLASLPIMIAVTLKLFVKSSDRAYLMQHLPMIIIGNVIACIAGLIAVGFLLNYLKKHDLKVFGWYRIGLAAIIAVVLFVQL